MGESPSNSDQATATGSQIIAKDYLTEEMGPFQKFANEVMWPLYARTFGMRFLHALALRHVTDIHEGDQVLELGSGYPPLWKFYADKVGRSGRFVAVDKSKWVTRKTIEFLKRDKKRTIIPEVITADAEELPTSVFSRNSFDKVIMSNLTNRPEEYGDFALSQAKRVLKPGGQVYISWSAFGGLPFGTVAQYRKFLRASGFEHIKVRPGLPDGLSLRWNWFITAQKPQPSAQSTLR